MLRLINVNCSLLDGSLMEQYYVVMSVRFESLPLRDATPILCAALAVRDTVNVAKHKGRSRKDFNQVVAESDELINSIEEINLSNSKTGSKDNVRGQLAVRVWAFWRAHVPASQRDFEDTPDKIDDSLEPSEALDKLYDAQQYLFDSKQDEASTVENVVLVQVPVSYEDPRFTEFAHKRFQ